MASAIPDPYAALGVSAGVSDAELRTAYRRLVQLHHPDHNGGSHESALRFAEVQEAYAHVKLLRKQATAGGGHGGASPGDGSRAAGGTRPDPDLEARLAAMERELMAAREQREKAARAAAEEAAKAAARARRRPGARAGSDRASDEELGYFSTDDSLTKILDDFAGEVSTRFNEARAEAQEAQRPGRPRSVTDWIDELGSRLTGEHHRKE